MGASLTVGLLIDSSVIIAGERGDAALGLIAADAASVAISAVTVAELWKASSGPTPHRVAAAALPCASAC